jgi:FMN phosphatase YigB (HAD superfamily)
MEKKVIILDFDGTLYSGEHKFDLIPDIIEKNKRVFLPHLTDEEYSTICKEIPSWNTAIFGSEITKSITEMIAKFPKLPISTKDFYNWQESHIDPIIIDPDQIVNLDFLQKLCRDYPVYIVSNSAPPHIVHYMKELSIDPKWFRAVISNPFHEYDTTKKPCYEDIVKKENIDSSNLFVFGDSRTSDLNPAKRISAHTGHVRDARLIPYMVKSALGLNISKEKEYIITTYNSMLNANEQSAKHKHKTELFRDYVLALGINL